MSVCKCLRALWKIIYNQLIYTYRLSCKCRLEFCSRGTFFVNKKHHECSFHPAEISIETTKPHTISTSAKNPEKASGVIYLTRLRLHSIPPTLQLNTKLSQINPAQGLETNSYSGFRELLCFKYDTLNTEAPLSKNRDVPLQHYTIHLQTLGWNMIKTFLKKVWVWERL